MDNFSDSLREAFKSSINFGVAWRNGILSLSSVLSVLAVLLVLFVAVFFMIIYPFWEKIMQLAKNPFVAVEIMNGVQQNLFSIVSVIAIAAIIFAVLAIIIGSFFESALLIFARNYLSEKKISSSEALRDAKKFVFPVFKARVMVGMFFLVLYATIMIPVILLAVGTLSSLPPQDIVNYGNSSPSPLDAAGAMQHILSLLFQLVSFLLSPFIALIVPAIIFNKTGSIDGMRMAWAMGTKNYFKNLLFLLVVAVAQAVVLFAAIIAMLIVFVILAIIAAIIHPLLIIAVFAIAIIPAFLILSWVASFNYLAIVKYYDYALSNF